MTFSRREKLLLHNRTLSPPVGERVAAIVAFIVCKQRMLLSVGILADFIGEKQVFGTLNLLDCPSAFVIDCYVPTISHVLP